MKKLQFTKNIHFILRIQEPFEFISFREKMRVVGHREEENNNYLIISPNYPCLSSTSSVKGPSFYLV